ncbi:MAG: PhzF family phenazine biosynthesis protein [Janthinobacterium lividum]
MMDVQLVRVFLRTADGGNPAPIVIDANGWDAVAMREVARTHGHESAFVLKPADSRHDFRFRFFVPNHEMEMCGHATLGALWLLRQAGLWRRETAKIETLSGIVEARYDADSDRILVSQPPGRITPIQDPTLLAEILDVLDLDPGDLLPLGIVNAITSRTKTLIPLRTTARLDRIAPKFDRIGSVCDRLSSTGLYPFAVQEDAARVLQARQFPRASGYPEDAATGIAAAALLYGGRHYGLFPEGAQGITVRQGIAMGRPSEIAVDFRNKDAVDQGCWISGAVSLCSVEES